MAYLKEQAQTHQRPHLQKHKATWITHRRHTAAAPCTTYRQLDRCDRVPSPADFTELNLGWDVLIQLPLNFFSQKSLLYLAKYCPHLFYATKFNNFMWIKI